MDPATQKSIEEAVRAAVAGTVPVAWAAAGIALASGMVGVLWAWGLGLSTKFAEKIEALAVAAQTREDARAKAAEELCTVRLKAVEDRCARIEASRDLAHDQHTAVLREAHAVTLERMAQNTEALEECSAALGLHPHPEQPKRR